MSNKTSTITLTKTAAYDMAMDQIHWQGFPAVAEMDDLGVLYHDGTDVWRIGQRQLTLWAQRTRCDAGALSGLSTRVERPDADDRTVLYDAAPEPELLVF